MQVIGCQTHRILPGESLETILDGYLPKLVEKDIVVITSKIVSLCQNRVLEKHQVRDKRTLIEQEADAYLADDGDSLYGICLTIKNNILIPSAGIDESNANDCYILYPENIPETAAQIWHFLRARDKVRHLGVVLTDSHTSPLRRGVTGIGLGWCGFEAIRNYVGTLDLFNKPLRVSMANLVDGIAAAAVVVMGEGNEGTPLCVVKDAPNVVFQTRPPSEAERAFVSIEPSRDIYAPILNKVRWLP